MILKKAVFIIFFFQYVAAMQKPMPPEALLEKLEAGREYLILWKKPDPQLHKELQTLSINIDIDNLEQLDAAIRKINKIIFLEKHTIEIGLRKTKSSSNLIYPPQNNHSKKLPRASSFSETESWEDDWDDYIEIMLQDQILQNASHQEQENEQEQDDNTKTIFLEEEEIFE